MFRKIKYKYYLILWCAMFFFPFGQRTKNCCSVRGSSKRYSTLRIGSLLCLQILNDVGSVLNWKKKKLYYSWRKVSQYRPLLSRSLLSSITLNEIEKYILNLFSVGGWRQSCQFRHSFSSKHQVWPSSRLLVRKLSLLWNFFLHHRQGSKTKLKFVSLSGFYILV
jgi:hypothetical protein